MVSREALISKRLGVGDRALTALPGVVVGDRREGERSVEERGGKVGVGEKGKEEGVIGGGGGMELREGERGTRGVGEEDGGEIGEEWREVGARLGGSKEGMRVGADLTVSELL